jgi:hypothetical protein
LLTQRRRRLPSAATLAFSLSRFPARVEASSNLAARGVELDDLEPFLCDRQLQDSQATCVSQWCRRCPTLPPSWIINVRRSPPILTPKGTSVLSIACHGPTRRWPLTLRDSIVLKTPRIILHTLFAVKTYLPVYLVGNHWLVKHRIEPSPRITGSVIDSP